MAECPAGNLLSGVDAPMLSCDLIGINDQKSRELAASHSTVRTGERSQS